METVHVQLLPKTWKLSHGGDPEEAELIDTEQAVAELTADDAPFVGEEERARANLAAGMQLLGKDAVYLNQRNAQG